MDNLLLWIISGVILFLCFVYSHNLMLAFVVLSITIILSVYYMGYKKLKQCEERCGKYSTS
jgi:hypothetical protein